MDVEVIDSEYGIMGPRGSLTDDVDHDPHESGVLNEEEVVEPYLGMEFDSEEAARTFYVLYAKRIGFCTCVSNLDRPRSDGTLSVRQFYCVKDWLRKRTGKSCEAMLKVELKGHGKWVVTKFVKEHKHFDTNSSKMHYIRPRRHFAGIAKHTVETYPGLETVPSGTMYVSVEGKHVPIELNGGADISPFKSSRALKGSDSLSTVSRLPTRKNTLGKDAQNLLDYFKKMQAENPCFYYAIQLDEDNRMANVFWADSRSRAAYVHFGDAVTLDTSYRVNQHKVPFAPFTGVNHHGQTILFACALLLDESEATFLWLFKTFLAAMNDRAPVSIVTDRDKAIQVAVAQVFPEARHCFNKWGILREGQERMVRISRAYPNFQVELYNCINLTQTIEEFEFSWDCLLEKYGLRRNDWLQSLYNFRRQWVPVYFRNSFFAAVSPNQGFESLFFDGYVNQQTTLPLFFRQYERALESSFEKEVEADLDTSSTSPQLKTPSPMEKQAADVYTRRIFSGFQKELVETFVYTANRIDGDGTISSYRVAKFEDDRKAYIVSLNVPEIKATCTCQMFEYCGILCRHILTVFTVTNVLTLPSHYILKRWTRNARNGSRSDDSWELDSCESLTIRYNNLCKEAIKCAEEGAITPETYDIVLNALKEAMKKVNMAKKNVSRVPPPSSQGTGVIYTDHRTSRFLSDTPLLWPRQDEMTRRFKLDDGNFPQSACLTLPHMAPVSLHPDDSPSENMMVLPCLKSMTWAMESKSSASANRVAVISLKLQDYGRSQSRESEVKFHLSRVTLEPMLRSMADISEQLSTPANKVAMINLKLQDTETTLGESEVKFQVSKDTLGAMLRSMAYIREQLSCAVEPRLQIPSKKQRK
ncbi:OLC1v1005024C5 [Oldenlandia corymbosa var. corymbosa]|uniref:Protein FAR1-RELATED SEQUENCE n=1 Tax=Oldenlandia corymbosa var. corymbosa TaxID=529605 RepID=A0AAV1DDM5_OLDCO|nr:OLC1v1005024C5 [Oldenlandia corymbosa var. corymbosa]